MCNCVSSLLYPLVKLALPFFLTSFFGFGCFERKNIFFSHFYFVYQHKSLNVKIFLYIEYVEFFFNNLNLENTLNYNLLTGKYLSITQSFSVIFLLFLKNFLKISFKDLFKFYFYFKFFKNNKKKIKVKFKYKNLLILFYFLFSNQIHKFENLFEL